MAHLAFQEIGGAAIVRRVHETPVPTRLPTGPRHDPLPGGKRLSALEWSVVALARRDTLASLRTPGRVALAMRAVFKQPNPMLADERLEALRRMAVLSWRHGYTVPSHAVAAFLDAGFTADQYEVLVDSIEVARANAALR